MEIKAAKKILKSIKLPNSKAKGFADGTRYTYEYPEGKRSWNSEPIGVRHVTWQKSGGHGGSKVISKVIEAAEALGFKDLAETSSVHPDGSTTTRGHTYVKDGITIQTSRHYGCWAPDNRFTITVIFPA